MPNFPAIGDISPSTPTMPFTPETTLSAPFMSVPALSQDMIPAFSPPGRIFAASETIPPRIPVAICTPVSFIQFADGSAISLSHARLILPTVSASFHSSERVRVRIFWPTVSTFASTKSMMLSMPASTAGIDSVTNPAILVIYGSILCPKVICAVSTAPPISSRAPARLSCIVSAIRSAAPAELSICCARLFQSSSLAFIIASIPAMASFPKIAAAAAVCSDSDNPPRLPRRFSITPRKDFMFPSLSVRLIPYFVIAAAI